MSRRPSPCEHAWTDLPVPGEPRGRVYQCSRCGTCGHRKVRFGGPGKIVPLTCNCRPGCTSEAKVRLFGRVKRTQFRWACIAHSEPTPTSSPAAAPAT